MPYFSSIKLKPDYAFIENPGILSREVKNICGQAEYVWRLQEDINDFTLMIASAEEPHFENMKKDYLFDPDTQPEIGSADAFLNTIKVGDTFKFTVKANPTKCARVNGVRKRVGITNVEDCIEWITRQGKTNGFDVTAASVCDISRLRFLNGTVEKREDGTYTNPATVSFVTVYYVGSMTITDPDLFKQTMFRGIGKCKTFGQGLFVLGRI